MIIKKITKAYILRKLGKKRFNKNHGARKSRYYRKKVLEAIFRKLRSLKKRYLIIYLKINTFLTFKILKAFKKFRILLVKDLLCAPHNGCRAPKKKKKFRPC